MITDSEGCQRGHTLSVALMLYGMDGKGGKILKVTLASIIRQLETVV